jgi:flagellar biogenesis protein FliO
MLAAWVSLCACAACSRGAAEEHAGKPIARDEPLAPAVTPPDANRNSYDLNAGRVGAALAAVIGLIFLLRWAGKSVLPASLVGGRAGAVKVLARCPVGPRQQIVLLQIGRRVLVAADCSSQLSSLCQITDADEVAALIGSIHQERTSPASAFTSWFSQARQAFGTEDELEKELAQPGERNADLERASGGGQREEIRDLTEKVRAMAREFGGRGPAA